MWGEKFLLFLAAIAKPLGELYDYVQSEDPRDPEREKQIAMKIIRSASDARARQEIGG